MLDGGVGEVADADHRAVIVLFPEFGGVVLVGLQRGDGLRIS